MKSMLIDHPKTGSVLQSETFMSQLFLKKLVWYSSSLIKLVWSLVQAKHFSSVQTVLLLFSQQNNIKKLSFKVGYCNWNSELCKDAKEEGHKTIIKV